MMPGFGGIPSSWAQSGSVRDRRCAGPGWPRRSRGPRPHPSWRVRPGSSGSPKEDSPEPVEERSKRCQPGCSVDLGGGHRSISAGPGPDATGAEFRVGRRICLDVDDQAADSVRRAVPDREAGGPVGPPDDGVRQPRVGASRLLRPTRRCPVSRGAPTGGF